MTAGLAVHDRTPAEALAAVHDHISDDDLAVKIAAHPDRDIFLALWRRILGDVAKQAEAEVPAEAAAPLA
jgi:hypothetical protein